MINKPSLISLIEKLDNSINEYAKLFSSVGIDFKNKFNNDMLITNERTVASFTNLKIKEFFESSPDIKLTLAVNEFPIEIRTKIMPTEEEKLINETSLPLSKRRKWKRCYIDGFFVGDNIYYQGTNYLFIEYKMNNTFVFSDLATDYLKYKLYTYNDKSQTIFCYAIFDKKKNYPSLLSHGKAEYFLIDNKITSATIQEKNVYLYLSNNMNHNQSFDELKKIYELYEGVSDCSNKINMIGEENFVQNSSKENDILAVLKRFNKKIICSSLIRLNYSYICEIYDYLTNNFKDEFEYISSLEGDDFLNFFNDGATYRSFFDNYFVFQDKVDAFENGLRASSFASFNIILLFDYFCELNNIETKNHANYPTVVIGRGNAKKKIDFSEVAENKKDALRNYYKKDINESNLFSLTKKIIYFICLVYPIMFEIDKDNNVIDYLPNRKIHDLLSDIQSKIKQIVKTSNYEKRIEINDISSNVSNQLLQLFGHIVNRY